MRRWFALGLMTCLLGCAGALPPGGFPLGAAGSGASPQPSASWFPPPLGPVGEMPIGRANPAIVPEQPCIGRTLRIEGNDMPHQRLTFWLKGQAARFDNGSGREEPLTSPDAIRLGEAPCDAKGDYALEVALPPQLGPMRDGGKLTLQPGAMLRLYAFRGTQMAYSMAFTLAAEACVPLPSLAPLTLSVEGLDACGDEPLWVNGEGLTGKTATLVLRRQWTRFGDSQQTEISVPVDAQGRVRYALPLDPDPTSSEGPVLTPDREGAGDLYFLRLYDPGTSRVLERPLLFCRGPLRAAFAAPSIAFGPGVLWKWRESEAPKTPSENGVLRSEAELSAFAARHGAPAKAVADALGVDWARQQVLAVWASVGPSEALIDQPEIVAVSKDPNGWTVHSALWATKFPVRALGAMHLVAVPRSDKPVRFLAPARGFYEFQRDTLRPEWLERTPVQVY